MIEIIIFSAIGIIHIAGIILFRKLIKDNPECVSKCCNINIEVDDNHS